MCSYSLSRSNRSQWHRIELVGDMVAPTELKLMCCSSGSVSVVSRAARLLGRSVVSTAELTNPVHEFNSVWFHRASQELEETLMMWKTPTHVYRYLEVEKQFGGKAAGQVSIPSTPGIPSPQRLPVIKSAPLAVQPASAGLT